MDSKINNQMFKINFKLEAAENKRIKLNENIGTKNSSTLSEKNQKLDEKITKLEEKNFNLQNKISLNSSKTQEKIEKAYLFFDKLEFYQLSKELKELKNDFEKLNYSNLDKEQNHSLRTFLLLHSKKEDVISFIKNNQGNDNGIISQANELKNQIDTEISHAFYSLDESKINNLLGSLPIPPRMDITQAAKELPPNIMDQFK